MGILQAFKTSADRKIDAERREAEQKKLALRMGQITKSVCRRGLYEHTNCSPYAPCFDICPVVTPGTADEADTVTTSLRQLPERAR